MANKIRNILSKRVDVNNNLEFDYLTSPAINFSEFPTAERIYVVEQTDINRIDYISYKIYGNPNYWWVIAQRNNIVNTFDDLFVGMKLYVPSLTDLFSYLNKKKKPETIDVKKYSTRRTL